MHASQASSTALLAATLLALADALPLKLEPLDMALLIARAEALSLTPLGTPATPSSTLMTSRVIDALTCLHARPGHLLRFSAQPHQLVGQVALPADLRLLALDTGVRYTASAATVAALRLAGAMGLKIVETIYRDLGQRHTPLHGHLANLSPVLYRQYFRALLPKRLRGSDFTRSYGPLPERVGPLDPAAFYHARTAVDHLMSEHEFAENFLQAIEELTDAAAPPLPPKERELTIRRAGQLLLASHHSYRLRLELSCREADWLVDRLMESGPDHGIFGVRITGTGGGGTLVALLDRSSQATDALLHTLSGYNRMTALHLKIAEAGTTGGGLFDSPLRLEIA